jgi:hypothetical protein
MAMADVFPLELNDDGTPDGEEEWMDAETGSEDLSLDPPK